MEYITGLTIAPAAVLAVVWWLREFSAPEED